MGDGYYDSYGRAQNTILCTDSFTRDECFLLVAVLEQFNILATLKTRNKVKNTYRIRISKKSMPLLRELVGPYMLKDYMYKLYGK
jgi:hypothetical protein